jgi:hypothetical protein
VVVESGALTVRVDEMAWTITRGAGSSEEVAPGEEATLEAGDSAYVPGGVNGGSATPGRSGQKPSSSSSGRPVRGLRQRRSPSP